MNRSIYFTIAEDLLIQLCRRIETRNKLNCLEFNIHAEDFYVYFLNLLYGYSLININEFSQNEEGLDLVDESNKIILQVTATATRDKVNSSLSKDLSSYKGYNFIFVCISKEAKHLRKGSYNNPHLLKFDPEKDIYDVTRLLNKILHLDVHSQEKIAQFLQAELAAKYNDPAKTYTNIAEIINRLASENLSITNSSNPTVPFNIDDKISFNDLKRSALLVEDYKAYSSLIDGIYNTFDQAGKNKSLSVLRFIRNHYIRLSQNYANDDLFFRIINELVKSIQNSSNHNSIPLDELEFCVNIIVVDAFIRCQIFQNPNIK
ncbi:SMEK domain-containing protein [Gilliamella sp. B2776]|uniref:ABC-three component system protein n=1 Tax=unclassified Gilliamella TaxID=2685620 RepID=UPI00226AB613|nr:MULTISPECIES: ABC-three component system protein [unclassified Gilliamella]MCX8650122.1 SMEK domain-containing protein [Gilliamella sp. B2779]MCX8653531.1 SMEK domain-containing protein [Gilliamella sp. B2737]MCX8692007.1 SMEK domain-containing protein [Gilliamella sp. B2776]MCX8703165.1 SMEK domain-containing protein [Gilliamella sp. B2781]WDM19792.1 SMEK domain-containing protein [Gilliamella sp. B3022]